MVAENHKLYYTLYWSAEMNNNETAVLTRTVPVQIIEQVNNYIDYLCDKLDYSPVPDSINLNKMTKEQFDAKMLKSYNEMLDGKGRPSKKVFDEILGR